VLNPGNDTYVFLDVFVTSIIGPMVLPC